MDEGKKYVVYGMRLKCDQGTMENYLSTDVGHGIVYQGQPVMNANDHEKGIHLTHFGDCNSKKVFEEAKKEADEKYKAEEGDGFFEKAGKWLAKNVTKAAVDFKATFMSNKCELVTPLPWLFPSEDHTIDGAPALMMESLCPCALGGVISIVPVVEEVAEEEVEETEQQEEKNFLDTLSEAYAAVIEEAKSAGELLMGIAALCAENAEANITSALHNLLNPKETATNYMQAILTFAPKGIKDQVGEIRSEDIKDIDQLIRKYEDKIYEKYQSEFEQYEKIRALQNQYDELLQEEPSSSVRAGVYSLKLEELNNQERELFKDISIMDELISMGNELNSMPAIVEHKNDMVNFFNLVYTNNPIDLKSRAYVPEENAGEVPYSIWARPWANENGESFSQDYAGNWLFGYVGAGYFVTPADGEVLKYGAGLAQLISDFGKVDGALDKYVDSLKMGNYGDNINEDGLSDAKMIQDGVDAYYENKK